MTKQGTPAAVSDLRPAMTAICAGSAASSPTHDSNKSPRMYSASASRARARRNSRNCSVISGRDASMCKSEMNRTATPSVVTQSWGGYAFDPLDDDRLGGRILFEGTFGAGGNRADPVRHIHALHDLAEYRVAPTILIRIERRIVGEVHVELHVSAVRLR